MNISNSSFKIDGRLALLEDEVQVWRVDLEAIRSHESRWQEILSADEANRASRFHFPIDRQRFVASRAWLRTILAGYLGVGSKQLRFSYSAKQKPSLAPPHDASGINFNLSHSGGIALYAFSRRRQIGVDVEQVRSDFDVEPLARRFFSAHEQLQLFDLPSAERVEVFFRCWTRKEAYVKATGDGLSLPLSQFDVSLEPGAANALIATRPDGAEAQRWLLCDLRTENGYTAAVCALGREWKMKAWYTP
jgi:4'-phosphopantetheinyl transferase